MKANKKTMKKTIGKVHPKEKLFLRQFVGTAKDGEGRDYEMALNMAGFHPVIQSKKTGKYFVLGWDDIIRLAIGAGIDNE
jgi:hypothetical protein